MNVADLPLLSLITFVPLIGAIVIAFLPRDQPGLIRAVALASALISFGLSLLLLIGFNPTNPAFQYQEVHDWIPAFGIQYKVGVDGLSTILVVLTTTLSWISILASFRPIKTSLKEYMISFLILEVGLVGVFISLDLFLFYIFWEVELVPMYLIIGIWGGANRIYATLKFVLYTLVGSLLMLVAILATAFTFQNATGSWVGAFDFITLRNFAVTSGFVGNLQLFAFLAFFLAFAIKVPMFPVHTWLPDAHTEAPTAGSVMLAAILLKLGAYGMIRFAVPLFPGAAHTFAPIIIVLSLIGIVYGAIVALVQPDWKRLIAYSSVTHMGFVTLGIFIFQEQGLQGAIVQMINHGLITGGLFLLVGVMYERTHDRTIAKFGGLAGRTPVYTAAFGFFVFASAGLPGLSGFVGEFLVLLGSFAFNPWVGAVTASCMIWAAAYLLYMFQQIFTGQLSDFLRGLGDHLTDISPIEMLTILPLAALIVAFGLFPGLILHLVQGSVTTVLSEVQAVSAIHLFFWQ
ncbi:MAG TPA: NADH-quinone oxidoreductase subunit M [Candidatus Limnocylindrales bacterium]